MATWEYSSLWANRNLHHPALHDGLFFEEAGSDTFTAIHEAEIEDFYEALLQNARVAQSQSEWIRDLGREGWEMVGTYEGRLYFKKKNK